MKLIIFFVTDLILFITKKRYFLFRIIFYLLQYFSFKNHLFVERVKILNEVTFLKSVRKIDLGSNRLQKSTR